MSTPRYGDNIYAIGAVVSVTLKGAGWSRERVDAVLTEISATKSYDDAIAVCERYITIKRSRK